MEQNAIIGAIALAALAIFGYARMFLQGRSEAKLKAVLPEAKILDVRSSGEFKESRYPGAVNVPLEKLAKSAKKLGNVDGALVLYCASGARARQAARILRGMGYRRVFVAGTMAKLEKLAG